MIPSDLLWTTDQHNQDSDWQCQWNFQTCKYIGNTTHKSQCLQAFEYRREPVYLFIYARVSHGSIAIYDVIIFA